MQEKLDCVPYSTKIIASMDLVPLKKDLVIYKPLAIVSQPNAARVLCLWV